MTIAVHPTFVIVIAKDGMHPERDLCLSNNPIEKLLIGKTGRMLVIRLIVITHSLRGDGPYLFDYLMG